MWSKLLHYENIKNKLLLRTRNEIVYCLNYNYDMQIGHREYRVQLFVVQIFIKAVMIFFYFMSQEPRMKMQLYLALSTTVIYLVKSLLGQN
jgi:hypothetical protein